MIARKFLPFLMIAFLAVGLYAQDTALMFEAENADSIGTDFEIKTEGDITYVTPKTDFAATTNPGIPEKCLIFEVTFDAPGTYDFYIRLRVGPQTYNDDSFYFANSFGERPANADAYWVRVNGIDYGATGENEYIESKEANTAGFEVFKWINASENGEGAEGGTLFTVEEDSLTKIFMIGSRENGLDIDKIAFGNADLYYTVSNLENGGVGITEIPEITNTLLVDLSSQIRQATHCATGALYGITETIPLNIDELVAPLNPCVYVQPARSGSGHQQPYGDAISVSERLESTTGQVMIRLADICPNWPYTWPGQESWLAEITSVINDKIASGRDNYYGYEIWNERHGTWQAANGDFYTLCWKPTYDLIRSLDPGAKIIGPSDSYYLSSRIEEFLTFCKENDCLPDVICWHELQGAANITYHINSYRSLETSLGLSELPISINEYCHTTQAYEGCPGTSAPFIAKFERNRVESASISWWFTALPGRLGSLLTRRNERGGGWWFYKWYGEMTGNMVSVTPPNENTEGLDGFACLDTASQYASICFGGDDTGTFDVAVSGIPDSFGDSVEVMVEHVPWINKDAAVSGPVVESVTTYEVADGAISVPVDVNDPLYGYRVYITPVGQMVAVDSKQEVLNNFALNQNYPNPFNPETVISFSIPQKQFVSLKVYNALGKEVAELAGSNFTAGTHHITFDASNLPSGVYLYLIRASSFSETRKMLLIR